MKVLKKLISLSLMLAFLIPLNAQEDAISKYFDQYMEDDRFTVVYVSSKLFSMFSKIDIDTNDEEAQAVLDIAKDVRGLRVLTTETTPRQFYDEAKAKINTKGYEVLMTVRDKGDDNVEFLVKEEGDIIKELLLLVGGDDEFVLLSFLGNLDLDKISKLAKTLDVDGAEHLEKLEDRENHK